jgi:hypothetical protein
MGLSPLNKLKTGKAGMEHFQQKWIPVLRPEMLSIIELERFLVHQMMSSDGKAL